MGELEGQGLKPSGLGGGGEAAQLHVRGNERINVKGDQSAGTRTVPLYVHVSHGGKGSARSTQARSASARAPLACKLGE